MSEKYGFIYLWYDQKHKRFYLGSHWGTETDGYICSSRWMRKSYKRRPEDFKRRIVKRVPTRADLLTEEHRYLSMIKKDELGTRFYNLTQHHPGHWSTTEALLKTVGEKISASPLRKERIAKAHTGLTHTEETKEKIRQIRTGTKHKSESIEKIRINSHKARDYSDPEFRQKMSEAAKNRSPETRAKISANSKRLHAEGRIGKKRKNPPK